MILPVFEIKDSQNGQFYIVLKAKNGQIVFKSEEYTQKHNCYAAIDTIKNLASEAGTVDLTKSLQNFEAMQ